MAHTVSRNRIAHNVDETLASAERFVKVLTRVARLPQRTRLTDDERQRLHAVLDEFTRKYNARINLIFPPEE